VQRLIRVIAVSWLAFVPTSTFAQGTLYKWVDSQGVAHYTNTPTDKKAKTVDDALPPASNFQRPAPPPEPAKETAKSTTNEPAATPRENPPAQAPEGSPSDTANEGEQSEQAVPQEGQ